MKKRCSLSRWFKENKWEIKVNLLVIFFIFISISIGCFVALFTDFSLNDGRREINASIITKYNKNKIIVYSDTTCFFDLDVSICDGEKNYKNTYEELQISKGKILTLTLENLAPDFFSDEAIITSVEPVDDTYVKQFLPTFNTYSKNNYSLLMKYSEKEIIVFSDKSCLFDLYVDTKDDDFNSSNKYCKIKIKGGETKSLSLNDLAPGFFTDSTKITYVNSYIPTYKK